MTNPTQGGQKGARADAITKKYLDEVGKDGLASVMVTKDGFRITVDQPAKPRAAKVGKAAKSPQQFAAENPGVQVRQGKPAKKRADVLGGQGMITSGAGGNWYCSVGFAAFTSTGEPATLGAGHCTQDGSSPDAKLEADPNISLGRVQFTQFGGPGNTRNTWDTPGTDYTAYTGKSGNANLVGAVTNWAGGQSKVTGKVSPVVGAPVCQSGRTTKRWNCGKIDSVGPFGVYGSDTDPNDVRWVNGFSSPMTTLNGDSGGAMVSGLKAVGVLSAGGPYEGVEYSYGADLNAATNRGYQIEVWLNTPQVANFSKGQTVSGTVPVDSGGLPPNTKVEIESDGKVTTVAVDASGRFTFTAPSSGMYVSITAVSGFSRSASRTMVWDTTLGSATGSRICGLKDGGCYQTFTNATVYWSPNTGAHSIRGEIRDKWGSLGWENGRLGYPTTNEFCGLKDGGCYQVFQGGRIYWSPSTGAHPVWGAPLASFAASGWESGKLGYPVADEVCGLRDGGCVQDFQKGNAYWSPRAGGHYTYDPIRAKYAATGYEHSRLGYPTTDVVCGLRDGGCYQNFQGGAILWSPATGAHTSWGSIRDKYAVKGYETGRLGFPTTDEVCGLKDGGCYQNYQGGAILWSPATGAHTSWGAIRGVYASLGYETGRLGFPTTDEVCGLKDGGCYQNFEGGAIVSSASGTWPTWGAIRGYWGANGFENGRFGYPTGAENCQQLGELTCTQAYQGGTISWTASRGAWG